MSETITSCPQCPRHCPIESPGCGRGRAFAQSLKNGGSSVTAPSQMEEYGPRGRSPHRHGLHGKHTMPDRSTLSGLILVAGHEILHSGHENEIVLDALTEKEQEQLKLLLNKLLDSWN